MEFLDCTEILILSDRVLDIKDADWNFVVICFFMFSM